VFATIHSMDAIPTCRPRKSVMAMVMAIAIGRICEIVSPTNAKDDTIKKLRLYHRFEIPHYWLVDPRDATLTAMRWHPDGYVTLARAERGEVVRAEPFEAVELAVGTLFGDDPPEG
jgi:Uma2 family endonuclease